MTFWRRVREFLVLAALVLVGVAWLTVMALVLGSALVVMAVRR